MSSSLTLPPLSSVTLLSTILLLAHSHSSAPVFSFLSLLYSTLLLLHRPTSTFQPLFIPLLHSLSSITLIHIFILIHPYPSSSLYTPLLTTIFSVTYLHQPFFNGPLCFCVREQLVWGRVHQRDDSFHEPKPSGTNHSGRFSQGQSIGDHKAT